MQFSAVLNIFIVKTYLNSTYTNDLQRKNKFSKNVHSCRVCSFKYHTCTKPLYFIAKRWQALLASLFLVYSTNTQLPLDAMLLSKLSRYLAQSTNRHVRSAKIQISLCICAICSEPEFSSCKNFGKKTYS